MEIYGNSFTYAGTSSQSDKLVIANVDTSRYQLIAGETSSNTVFSRRGKLQYYTGTDYSKSAISFEADIVTEDGSPIPSSSIRRIEKWLFNKQGYSKLYIDGCPDDDPEEDAQQDSDDDADDNGSDNSDPGVDQNDGEDPEPDPLMLYFNARFTNPSAIEGNGGVIGYTCTVECDSLMLWEDPTVISVTSNLAENESDVIDITVDTDLKDYVYPKVTFEMGSSGGDLIVANNSDIPARITEFSDLPASLVFIMDSSINYISGQNYTRFTGKNFIRLVDGVNHLSVVGNLKKITIQFQNRRYLK